MSEGAKLLMSGKFPDIKKMSKEELQAEVNMWRNIWNWMDSAQKYYYCRIGQMVGIQVRNYHRYLGPLLETHWDLTEVELGVYERVHDINTGEAYYERKIIRLPSSQIIGFEWIEERNKETEMANNEQTSNEGATQDSEAT